MTKYMLVSFKTCPWVQRAADRVLREKKTGFRIPPYRSRIIGPIGFAISLHKKVPVLRIDDKISLF